MLQLIGKIPAARGVLTHFTPLVPGVFGATLDFGIFSFRHFVSLVAHNPLGAAQSWPGKESLC
jgi:hypothetical protein